MSRIFKPFVFLIAAIYFLVDAVFFTLFKPVFRRLADCWVFEGLRAWIVSLRPYPTLALFIIPVILLEPVKPVAAYLTATGHIVGGLMVLIVGELLKLLLIERLFSVSRDKLMSIPVFAWCYHRFCQGQTGSHPCRRGNSRVVGASMPSTLFKNISSNSRLRRGERGFLGARAEPCEGRQPMNRNDFRILDRLVSAVERQVWNGDDRITLGSRTPVRLGT